MRAQHPSAFRLFFPATVALAAATFAACSSNDDTSPPPGSSTSADGGSTTTTTDGGATAVGDDGGTSSGTVNVQILAFNDFHGNLLPPSPTNGAVLAKKGDPAVANVPQVDNGDGTVTVQAGGAAYLAAHLATLKAGNANTLIVSSGDLTGAAPLLSNEYADEPTVDVMNTIGLDLEGVGNHDFDHGAPGVLRFQSGGCDPSTDMDAGFGEVGSCVVSSTFGGAKFEYLAANVDVVDASAAMVPDSGPSSGTLFPPYAIEEIGGAKIAFIGMTLNGTPTIVSGGLPGLQFADEVTTANALVTQLKSKDVDAIVVLLHQGGFQTGTYDDCTGLTGTEIERIAAGLDPAVTFIHSAHTHEAYNCTLNGRPVAQAASFGRVITQYQLSIDTAKHAVTSVTATNVPVTRDVTPDPTIDTMVQGYLKDLAPLADTVEGYVAGDIGKIPGTNGEAPLGDFIADAMLWAANDYATSSLDLKDGDQRVDVSFINVGGIRDGLFYDTSGYLSQPDGGAFANGTVTYQQTQAIEPFGDVLDIVECTGQQIIDAVQQNIYTPASLQLLQQSGLTYSWSASAAMDGGTGAADPTSFKIADADGNPQTLKTTGKYYVAGVTFFTQGGDGYSAFKNCTEVGTFGVDLDALNGYLRENSTSSNPLAVPTPNRITRKD